jgi:DNA mismatch repair protein MLH1
LKKQGESSADIRTESNSTVLANIGILYGQAIVKELINFEVANDRLGSKIFGFVTHANFSQKKFNFLLFINHRAVECGPLKRSLELLYANYLPRNAFPFVYISIEIRPDYGRN